MNIITYSPSDYTSVSAKLTSFANAVAPRAASSISIPRKGILHSLRQRGFKIRVRHYRWAAPKDKDPSDFGLYLVTRQNHKDFSYISSLGGETEVDVTFQDGTTVSAHSICSQEDNYCRRLGAYLAFKRAVRAKKGF